MKTFVVRLGDLVLALLWVRFAYIHFLDFFLYFKLGSLLFACTESFIFALFLLRERPTAVSERPLDWSLAFVGTFLVFLYQPVAVDDNAFGTACILLGTSISLASLLFLNRSFGIVPALRTLKLEGPYRIVRHPMYSGYIATYVGYFVNNPTLANAGIMFACIAFQIARIAAEERMLSADKSYRLYQKEVHWKLFPFVF